MKIPKTILWITGIAGAAYLAKKFFFTAAPAGADPLQGRPNRGGGSIQEGEKTNFTGKTTPRKRFDPGFDGEFPESNLNEGFDMMTGPIGRLFSFMKPSTAGKKWLEPNKSSGGTLSCPRGYHLTTDSEGSKWCVSDASAAKLVPGAKDKYNQKLADLKKQGLSL